MPEAIRFVASAGRGVETAANRQVLDPNAPPLTDAMAEVEFRAQATASIGVNAEIALAAGEEGFQLRVAFEALGHLGHGRAR